jgi:hypothetical protein
VQREHLVGRLLNPLERQLAAPAAVRCDGETLAGVDQGPVQGVVQELRRRAQRQRAAENAGRPAEPAEHLVQLSQARPVLVDLLQRAAALGAHTQRELERLRGGLVEQKHRLPNRSD